MKIQAIVKKALLVAATLACSVPASASEKTFHRARIMEPLWSSGHLTSLGFKLGLESSDFNPPTPTQMTPQLQLWDISNVQQVPFVLQLLPQGGHYLEMAMKPKSALISGHRYGVRLSSTSTYTGLTGRKELGFFYVGTWPRVSGLHFKGGRTLYLVFSEPIEPKTVETAVSLTNSQTGKRIAVVYKNYTGVPTHLFTLELDGSLIDVAVEHTLRVSKTVKSARGAGLDGRDAGPGQLASDFVMPLSPAQLDIFVNGYPKESLEIRCLDTAGWWDADSEKPVPLKVACVQTRPVQNTDEGGCSLRRGKKDEGIVGGLLLLLSLFVIVRRCRSQAGK